MSISPARRIAFDTLLRVSAGAGFAADILHTALGPGIRKEDAALATDLTYGCLRWQRLLDAFLGTVLRKPIGSLDPEVRVALHLGLYQLRFLDRIPPSAAVNESVELTKRAGKTSAASVVNAVLRRAMEHAKRTAEAVVPSGASAAARLGVIHSHPDWLVERWLRAFGESRTVSLLEWNNLPARTDCALQCAPSETGAETERVLSALRAAGCDARAGAWLRGSLTVLRGAVANLDEHLRGVFRVQDQASRMVALLLAPGPRDAVLDLCAGAGGKTLELLVQTGPTNRFLAADLHWHALRALRMRMRPAAFRGREVWPIALDATSPLPLLAKFDRIMIDAPCSGTGTLSRNPEIRWRLGEADLPALCGRQLAMLCNAAHRLTPGGRMVYATCSLEAEENEGVVEEFLRLQPAFRTVDPAHALAPHLADSAQLDRLFQVHGEFRTWPPETRTDGFYAVVLESAAAT